ncbi:hypothetical protein ACFLQ9_00480 [Bacteroidota bacterium]
MKRKELKKKSYTKPKVEKIKIDKNISMVMTSPPGDPDGSFGNIFK